MARSYTDTCNIDGCDRPFYAHDLCKLHYDRRRYRRDMDAPVGQRFSDDTLGVPYICVCPVAQPEPCGQCHRCLRVVVATWPPDAFSAALTAYPEVCVQKVDWSLRKAPA